MGLTALEIKNAKPGMHADGNGLYLCVKPSGTKSWVFRFQIAGKRREMGLGSLQALEPVKARSEAARLKSEIATGHDPLESRRSAVLAQKQELAQVEVQRKRDEMTFHKACEHYISNHQSSWRNAKHAQQWANTLKTYAYPIIGDLPVADVSAAHVVAILQPIWTSKSETASRLRMRIEAVLNAAKLMGWRTGENPAIYKGGLEAVFPPISKVKKVRHHPAMPFTEISDFMVSLRARSGISPRALEFCILTAARSGEVRYATWDDLDLDACVWTIPADRMKAGREHRVPLCHDAITVLEAMPRFARTKLVFPGTQGQAMSDMTLSAVLKRIGLGHFTVHGFRSTFRDWAAETTDYSSETVEMALAHTVANKVEAAYRRGDLFAKRRVLMDDWASYIGHDDAEKRG
ncbi:MAG: hypothetical protein RIQ99_383 [Pseudomonadota bacterium]